jgi:hypothetical protein
MDVMTRTNLLLGLLVFSTALTACDSSAPGGSGQISFNVATRAAGSAATRPATAPDSLLDGGGNVLVLTSVELVLRDIEFKRQNHDSCDSLGTDNDGCEKFEAGPVLVDLPLGAGVTHEFSVAVDSGTFDKLELRIHKPEDDGDARDRAFLAAHPDLDHVSIRVTGAFNGTAFTFVTDLNADQELALSPPFTVSGQSDVAVTLMVDISRWFLSGSLLIDPSLALKGGSLEGMVKNNIEGSFAAFNDNDKDGHDDSGSDDALPMASW